MSNLPRYYCALRWKSGLTRQMSVHATEEMSAVETGQMSAVETGQMAVFLFKGYVFWVPARMFGPGGRLREMVVSV